MRVYNRNKHAQRPYHISKQVVLSIKEGQERYTFQAFSETRLLFPVIKVCQLIVKPVINYTPVLAQGDSFGVFAWVFLQGPLARWNKSVQIFSESTIKALKHAKTHLLRGFRCGDTRR